MHQPILPGVGIGAHGTEFVTAEFTSLAPNTPCFVEDWAGRIHLDGNGGQQQQWRSDRQRNDADEEVHETLHKKTKGGNRLAIEFQYRDGADVIHSGADRETTVKVRYNFHANTLAACLQNNTNDQVTADRGCEINLVDEIFRENAGQVVRCSQAERPGAGLPVNKSTKRFSQLSVTLEISAERLSNLAAAHDEHVLITDAALNALQVIPLHDVTHTKNTHKAEERRGGDDQPRNRFLAGNKNNHDGDHGRNHEALQNPAAGAPGGTDGSVRIKILSGIADDREAGIGQQEYEQTYRRGHDIHWRNTHQFPQGVTA